MKKIVILGGGYGGVKIARTLIEKEFREEVEVVLVDRMPYHALKTEFYALSAGTIADKDVRVDFPKSDRLTTVFDEIIHIDVEEKKVNLRKHKEGLTYDFLIVALGCEDDYHDIEGAREYTQSIQTIKKARKAYQEINNLDAYSKVIIVGGGLSGVEMAAELRESRSDLNIKLLDRGDGVLRPFEEKIRNHAMEWFEKRDVEIITHSKVDYVEEGAVCNNGICILSDATVWTAGVQPNKMVRNMPVEKDMHGKVVIDEYHRVPTHQEIFVVGDCASLPFSPSAQLAEQQGEQVAVILSDLLNDRELKIPGKIKLKGTLGALGKNDGFATFNDAPFVGLIPRFVKTGVLWLHKRH